MRITCFIVCFIGIALAGCSERRSEERLLEMAVKLEENSTKIGELSVTLEGINTRLSGIEESLRSLAQGSSGVGKPSPGSASAPAVGNVDLESTFRQVTVLTEELASLKDEMASTKEALEKTARELSRQGGKDAIKAIHALAGEPEEFVKGLDKLLESGSVRIGDPVARQSFESELLQLRDRVVSGYSPEELYQELRAGIVEKLNFASDEEDRQEIQRAISNLDNCTEQELQKRLDHYGRERTLHELFRVVKTYGLQMEDLVVSFPRLSRKK